MSLVCLEKEIPRYHLHTAHNSVHNMFVRHVYGRFWQVWFWLYILLIFLIMLNMLLAIIMDVYCEAMAYTQ